MDGRNVTPTTRLKSTARLLLSYRGEIGRRDFMLAELVRGAGVVVCYGLYHEGWFVVAATLLPVAVWPGVVATIKRFRDLGHDPVLILPVLMYLSTGLAVGYRYDTPVISGIALGVYLLYVGGVDGQSGAFGSDEYMFDV